MSEQYGLTDQTDDTGRRPYSFDLTLEQQLDNESLPPLSPSAVVDRPQSVDTHVLASIITQLRTSLTEVTRDRDELAKSLAEFRAREADVKDAIANMSEKCSNMQDHLDKANDRIKEDENTISILRGKVEESRRGLMRLQSENRRASQLPPQLDLSRAGTFASLPISSAKRASFAPLTGSTPGRVNAHRRISSVTDARLEGNPSSPNAGSFGFTELSSQLNKVQPSPSRPSSLYQRQSSPSRSLRALEDSPEVETLRKEVNTLKAELEEVKHELSESNEAREASELCVRALRAFIEENNVGVSAPSGSGISAGSSSSTSMPSTSSQAEPKKSIPAVGGWGFKLWRAETLTKSPAPATPTTLATSGAAAPAVQGPPPQPLTKKFGDFFGTRASVTSFAAVPTKSLGMEQEPMCNGMSDTSSVEDSVAEPVSPASDLPRPVFVRDSVSVTSGSSRDLGASPDQKAVRPSSPPAIEGPFMPVAL